MNLAHEKIETKTKVLRFIHTVSDMLEGELTSGIRVTPTARISIGSVCLVSTNETRFAVASYCVTSNQMTRLQLKKLQLGARRGLKSRVRGQQTNARL